MTLLQFFSEDVYLLRKVKLVLLKLFILLLECVGSLVIDVKIVTVTLDDSLLVFIKV